MLQKLLTYIKYIPYILYSHPSVCFENRLFLIYKAYEVYKTDEHVANEVSFHDLILPMNYAEITTSIKTPKNEGRSISNFCFVIVQNRKKGAKALCVVTSDLYVCNVSKQAKRLTLSWDTFQTLFKTLT